MPQLSQDEATAKDVTLTMFMPPALRLDGKIRSGETLEVGNVTRSADLGFSFTVAPSLGKTKGGRVPLQVGATSRWFAVYC